MKITFAAIILALASGCMGTSGLVRQLARDPASAYISVDTLYGKVKLVRANPGTNVTVTVSPEGAVSVDSNPSTGVASRTRSPGIPVRATLNLEP